MNARQMVSRIEQNHSVALRNAGNAALAKQVARCEDCGDYGRIMEDHPLNDLTAPTYRDCPRCARKALIVSEVNALLAKGLPLSFALSTVQCIENAAARGEDLEYGPFFNVERVWEMRVEAGE